MRTLLLFAFVTLAVVPAHGQGTIVSESWEGTHTVLGMFGTGEPPIIAEAVADFPVDPVHGDQVLRLIDNSPSGTPQAFVAWVRGLLPGDTVEAILWRYDDTPGTSPSCRLWGHWNDDPEDINGYDGSAGGNDDYGPGTGWDQTSWTWTVPPEAAHTGLVIEVRTYSNPGDTIWVDALEVTAPLHATVLVPGDVSPVESRTWGVIKSLYR